MKKVPALFVVALLIIMLIPSTNSFSFSTPKIFSSVLEQKQPFASTPTALYDRTAVAAYADKFWDIYNPAYNDYSGSGGDCANFVSQCMIAGGLSLWKGRDGSGGGVDSKGTMPFCDYLHQNLVNYQSATWDYIEWSGTAPSWLSPGDVIIYGDASNETSPDYWRHAVIVVEGYGSDAKISAHTTDRYHVAWTYAFPSSFHRTNFYHLPNGTITEYTQFKVTASAVNVRIGPGIQPPYDTPIGQITLDQKYIAYEYVINATGKKWWHFWFDNKSAWGSADYTTAINESIKFKVDIADLNVRTGPGASYPIVGNVFNGQTFTAFESTTNGTLDWYRFWYQGRNDTWCCANYTIPLEAKSLAGYKICVDPGHGGTDPGAVGPTGYKESDANLDIGLRLRDLLVADGATVYMTRTTDVYVSLADRVALANNNNCNIFCSNHNNAYDGTAQGTETYYHSSLPSDPSASNSGRLATYVQNELIAHLGRTNRGVKQADFYVLRETTMPAELTEVMFIDNPTEEALLKDPNVRQGAAMSIYHGICRYFGITPTLKTDLLVDGAGNNVYGTASNGAGGASNKSVSGSGTIYFTIALQNDGNVSDIFNINIPTTPTDWAVKLYGSDNATQITTFPWATPIISSGSTYTMYLHVTAPASPSSGNHDTIIGATSVGDSAKVDSVTARANVSGIISDKVAIWHFNEGSGQTAYDASGNNNVATIGSSPSADANDTTWYNGIAGYGMQFNENDFMYALNSPSLQISGDLTIKAWLYPTNISKGRQGVISKHYNYEYDIIMEDGSIGCPCGQISFYHGNGTWEEIQEPSGMVVSENQWNYIAITRNMTDKKIRFYLNGKFVGADDFVAAPVVSAYNISIGWRKAVPYYFSGIVDEVEIYNRVLTDKEIADSQEMRALWAARWDVTNATNIDNLITTCKNGNINTIFFQARGEGYALYNSTIDPKYPSVTPTEFDPLGYVIDKAHQNGLEVHAWINFYNSGRSGITYPANHVLTLHPEWGAVDKYGSSGTGDIYLCPGNLDVQNYLYNISIEIVKNYDVDGIHYDYVRYQNSSFCYCDVCKERFKAEYGYYPPTTGSDENWNSWRKAQVTDLVEKIYLDAKTLKPYLGVGAAVWGVYAYGLDYFQDSHSWLYEGILDYIAPMTYYTDNALFNSSIQDHINNSYGKHVYAGIGVYKFVPDDKTQMVAQIDYARNLGANGVVLFSYASLRDYPSFVNALVSGGGAESQDNSSASVGVRLEVTSYHRAQRFIPARPILTKVELPINATISTATATVAVRGDDGGSPSKPTGAPLASTTVTLTTTTGPTWITIDFDDISLTTGKTYWICVSWDGANTISWYGSTDYDSDPAYSTDSGTTWAISTWNGVYGYKTYTKEAGGTFNATANPPALSLISIILSLSAGWNFISLPVDTPYTRAGDLASAIPNCTKIAKWDITNQSFTTYSTSSPSENNFTIDNGHGYRVYVSAQTFFRTNGTLVISTSTSLSVGWNSIGWLNSTRDAESVAQKISNCTSIAYWDSTLGRFVVHPVYTNISNFMIQRSRGYLVYVTGASVWTQE